MNDFEKVLTCLIDEARESMADSGVIAKAWSFEIRKHIASEIDKDSMQEKYISLLESRGMKRDKAVIFSVAYYSGIENTLKAIQEGGKK